MRSRIRAVLAVLILSFAPSARADRPIDFAAKADEGRAYRYLMDRKNFSDPHYATRLRFYLSGNTTVTSGRFYSEGAPLVTEEARIRSNEAYRDRDRLMKSSPTIVTYRWDATAGASVPTVEMSFPEKQREFEDLSRRWRGFAVLSRDEVASSRTVAPVVDYSRFDSPTKAKRLMEAFVTERGAEAFFEEIVYSVFMGKPTDSANVDARVRTVADLLAESAGRGGVRDRVSLELLEERFKWAFQNGNFDGVQLVFEVLEATPGAQAKRKAQELAAYAVTEEGGYVGRWFVRGRVHPRIMKVALPHLDLEQPSLRDVVERFLKRATSGNPITNRYAAEEFMRRFGTDLEILFGAPKAVRDRLIKEIFLPFQLNRLRELLDENRRMMSGVESALTEVPAFRRLVAEAKKFDAYGSGKAQMDRIFSSLFAGCNQLFRAGKSD